MWIKNLILCLLLMAPSAHAQPQFTHKSKGEIIPFNGFCYNAQANAELISKPNLVEAEYKLKLEFSEKKKNLEFNLIKKLSENKIKHLNERHKLIIDNKTNEIKRLTNSLSEASSHHTGLWTIGGFIAGALTVIVITKTL